MAIKIEWVLTAVGVSLAFGNEASTMRKKLSCMQSSSSIRRAEGAKAVVTTAQAGRKQDACMFLKVQQTTHGQAWLYGTPTPV